MDEQVRIILIIIVSVAIFGLLLFVFVKNYIKNKINYLVKEEKNNNDETTSVRVHQTARVRAKKR